MRAYVEKDRWHTGQSTSLGFVIVAEHGEGYKSSMNSSTVRPACSMMLARVFRFRSCLCMGSVTRSWLVRVLEDIVAAGGMVNEKACSLESTQNFFRFGHGKCWLIWIVGSVFKFLKNPKS